MERPHNGKEEELRASLLLQTFFEQYTGPYIIISSTSHLEDICKFIPTTPRPHPVELRTRLPSLLLIPFVCFRRRTPHIFVHSPSYLTRTSFSYSAAV